jgi:large subunit ribosomal protein L15
MRLTEIRDNPGARKKRTRVGRGLGSGLGKTSGRGQKGQGARTGVSINGFEGGQMPLYRRLPKRGFNKPNQKEFAVVNLDRIQKAIDAGKLSASATVDAAALLASGVLSHARDGVRLLGRGELKQAVTFNVAGASASAIEAVTAKGGAVNLPPVLPPRREPKKKKDKKAKKGGDE